MATEEERQEMLSAFGLGEGALARMIRAAYHLFGRRTFLTTGDKESRAWTFKAGYQSAQCAVIHTDFQRGFIKAEVVHWDELLELGSWSKADGCRQAAHRRQGLRDAGRRRRRVPVQRIASGVMLCDGRVIAPLEVADTFGARLRVFGA